MLEPQASTPTRLPAARSRSGPRTDPSDAVQAGSATIFSVWRISSIVSAIRLSGMVISSSTFSLARVIDSASAIGAPRLSAIVLMLSSVSGLPDAKLRDRLFAPSGSTPMISVSGLIFRMAAAMPAISPPPPTGSTTISSGGISSTISAPQVAAPYAMFMSLKGCRILRPSSASILSSIGRAAAIPSTSTTSAPRSRHPCIR